MLLLNLIIYVSLIHQFWQTASSSTSENGEMEITATIDGRIKTITKAFIRRHLKLEDSDGIITLPNTEILEQLTLKGVKFFRVKDQQSQLSPITHPPMLHPPRNHQLYHHLCKQPMLLKRLLPCPHDSPLPRVHTLGSDGGSMTLNELMVLCTTLSKKVESLESDLKQTKLTYGAAYTKLIMKVKKLDNKGRKIAQIDEDEGITLVQMGAQTQGRHESSTASPEVKTARVSAVDALDDITFAETLMEIRKSATKPQKEKGIVFKEVSESTTSRQPQPQISAKDKGKAIMIEPKKPSKKKDQIQIDEELALRLHAEEQAELERMQRERIAQEEASRAVINEELDSIQAMIEADEELAARL
ncbi:hypothetical protein Tco_1151595 [Tanacetum coccineum]